MNKLLAKVLITSSLLLPSIAFASIYVDPTNPAPNTSFLVAPDDGSVFVLVSTTDDININFVEEHGFPCNFDGVSCGQLIDTGHYYAFQYSGNFWGSYDYFIGKTLSDLRSVPEYQSEVGFYVGSTPSVGIAGISGMIDNASSSFNSILGVNPGGVVSWVGDNLIKPILGSGIQLFWSLSYWIVTMALLSGILYVGYRFATRYGPRPRIK